MPFRRPAVSGVPGPFTGFPAPWVRLILILVIVSSFLAGCGYRPLMVTSSAPGGGVSVPLFSNLTPRPDVDRIMTEAFIRRFLSAGVRVDDSSRGALMLKGVVEEISFSPAAFSAADATVLSRLSGRVRVTISRSDGTLLQEDDFRETVLLPYPDRLPDRPVVDEAGLRELADRIALKGLRALSRLAGEKVE